MSSRTASLLGMLKDGGVVNPTASAMKSVSPSGVPSFTPAQAHL